MKRKRGRRDPVAQLRDVWVEQMEATYGADWRSRFRVQPKPIYEGSVEDAQRAREERRLLNLVLGGSLAEQDYLKGCIACGVLPVALGERRERLGALDGK